MRLGILGGTFDPPHTGHLLAASDAFERLGLHRVLFIPAARQPLKTAADTAPAGDRLAMVRLLVEGDPRFAVDTMEIDREGLSYMVDTLEALAAREPAADRFLLVGEDVLGTFGQWRAPDRILALATLVVLRRTMPGQSVGSVDDPKVVAGGRVVFLESRTVDISSTEIRARVRAGQSLHGFVPDAIARHIERAGLYR